jgi:hypothetical protein
VPHLNVLLQGTKETISITQSETGNCAVSKRLARGAGSDQNSEIGSYDFLRSIRKESTTTEKYL